MFLLENKIMNYAWGSHAAIAELQGRSPSSVPEAELWMGAHPKAPSTAFAHGEWRPLTEMIAKAPVELLGENVALRFGQLPFLFKVLAAAKPLSLQAHPDLARAGAGFAEESAARVSLSSPHRNYKDKNHKPELICALSPFEALCGFRDPAKLADVLTVLANKKLSDCFVWRKHGSIDLEGSFRALMTTKPKKRARIVGTALAALAGRPTESPFENSFVWAERLAVAYPGDIGVLTSLMLNHIVLAPGESLYLPAGNLHAYLCGTGLELMANSDNVLRGGLTPKHVDVPELLRVLNFQGGPVEKRAPVQERPGQWRYQTPAAEFELWKLEIGESPMTITATGGPEILIVVEGTVTNRTAESIVELRPGDSALVPANAGDYELSGPAIGYRATVPQIELE